MALPKPVGRQQDVVYLPSNGHQVVLGTAGSGKTSMAILRAAVLSDGAFPGGGKTLLLTFNKTLSSYIRFLAADLLGNVTVENFHKFARGYLSAQGQMTNAAILPTNRSKKLIEEAVAEVAARHDPHSFFLRPVDFFKEEIRWLSQHGITTKAEYVAVERTGRADARMARALRPTMWDIRESYQKLRNEAGYPYDVDEIAVNVAKTLDSDTGPRLYKHIILDEGQDLSPAMLRALPGTCRCDRRRQRWFRHAAQGCGEQAMAVQALWSECCQFAFDLRRDRRCRIESTKPSASHRFHRAWRASMRTV